MRPQDATQKKFVHNGKIIYTSSDGGFSIAEGEWTDDRMNRFAIEMEWRYF